MSRFFPSLILASSSPYRRALLERLNLSFDTQSPNVDETPLPHEDANALALRLAHCKAETVHQQHPEAHVIGSDQVCAHHGQLLGKAGTIDQACTQLASFSGEWVTFHTGLALIEGNTGRIHTAVETYRVHFRELSEADIVHYIERERPLDSAGSFYMEGLGVALFSKMEGDDPTTLMGLPLIRVCDFLRRAGIDPLRQ